MNLFESFQNMSSQMNHMKLELEKVVVQGNSGGGLISITMNGQFVVQKVHVDDDLLQKEKKTVLEELLRAAFVDASEKVRFYIKDIVGKQSLA